MDIATTFLELHENINTSRSIYVKVTEYSNPITHIIKYCRDNFIPLVYDVRQVKHDSKQYVYLTFNYNLGKAELLIEWTGKPAHPLTLVYTCISDNEIYPTFYYYRKRGDLQDRGVIMRHCLCFKTEGRIVPARELSLIDRVLNFLNL